MDSAFLPWDYSSLGWRPSWDTRPFHSESACRSDRAGSRHSLEYDRMCHVSSGPARFFSHHTCFGRSKQHLVHTHDANHVNRGRTAPHFSVKPHHSELSQQQSRPQQRRSSESDYGVPQVETYIPLTMCLRESERRERARGSGWRKDPKPLQHTPTHTPSHTHTHTHNKGTPG